MDRGAWWAYLWGRKESDTTEQLTMHTQPSLERGHWYEELQKVRELLCTHLGKSISGGAAASAKAWRLLCI